MTYSKELLNWAKAQGLTLPEESTDIKGLEILVDEKWGDGIFDWTIGKTIEDDKTTKDPASWFWYCGTKIDQMEKTRWLHSGYAPSIAEALQAMLAIE